LELILSLSPKIFEVITTFSKSKKGMRAKIESIIASNEIDCEGKMKLIEYVLQD
jgi:hypothetical protein